MLKKEYNRILNNKKIEDKSITREYEAYNKGLEDAQEVFNMLTALEETNNNMNKLDIWLIIPVICFFILIGGLIIACI